MCPQLFFLLRFKKDECCLDDECHPCQNESQSFWLTDIGENDLLFDDQEFKSEVFQRPFQYLYKLDTNQEMPDVDIRRIEGTHLTCLQTLLK